MGGDERLEFHKYADFFPLIEHGSDEWAALVESIRSGGLEEPIWLYEGRILDGRNRYLACLEAGVEPSFREYEGDDPLGFVLRKNIDRRHLSASQRACIAAEIVPELEEEARRRMGARTDLVEKIPRGSGFGKSRDLAAQRLAVNPHYVSDARRIMLERPDLFEVMKSGGVHMREALHILHEEARRMDRNDLDGNSFGGKSWRVFCGDIREWNPPQRYDLILTRMPKSSELAGVLTARSRAWLSDGGLLVVARGGESLRRVIERVCEPGMSVLDPLMGSGEVLLAAVRLGCLAHGLDIDPDKVGSAKEALGDVVETGESV